ncbi:DNA-directed RNA polymerase subunit D [Frankliniella fusca]|uniref:DNA-directed RNA polymerase subunit D n=1 Tax=Frankliniella fusca TaxID=407009 RepID=A0AAE1L5S3_9NEOP|nr:DNA-directed RNA polymerase subunit D [Frankliniella fusca]
MESKPRFKPVLCVGGFGSNLLDIRYKQCLRKGKYSDFRVTLTLLDTTDEETKVTPTCKT